MPRRNGKLVRGRDGGRTELQREEAAARARAEAARRRQPARVFEDTSLGPILVWTRPN